MDDTEGILMLFSAILEAHGAEVTTAEDGKAFLEQIENLFPDLILLDIQMPKMDGYAILQQIKAIPALCNTPVVALTAHAMSGDMEKILEAGFTGYIAKPVDTRAFPDQVASFLSSGTPST
ncbi:response regulator [Mariprofundus ferrinatatus]|uniref:response regulator n=1 Tax=Mariprofundus ferrinatatus TaxID=1921087 RepID=UPI001E3791DA|nr:response regulator [Mariprofundus ferrinatatus]